MEIRNLQQSYIYDDDANDIDDDHWSSRPQQLVSIFGAVTRSNVFFLFQTPMLVLAWGLTDIREDGTRVSDDDDGGSTDIIGPASNNWQ